MSRWYDLTVRRRLEAQILADKRTASERRRDEERSRQREEDAVDYLAEIADDGDC